MWMRHLANVDPTTGLTGFAVLCAVWTQSQSTRKDEPWSELICWILLPILCRLSTLSMGRALTKPDNSHSSADPNVSAGASQWAFAICIATRAVCEAEQGSNWLLPLLIPLLSVTEQYLKHNISRPAPSSGFSLSAVTNAVWGTAATALFGIFALIDFSLIRLALSVTSAAAAFIAYLALLDKSSSIPPHVPHINIGEDIESLSIRVVVTLIAALPLKAFVVGNAGVQMAPIIILGASKACTWFLFIKTAHFTTWRVAVPITVFSILSTTNPYSQSSSIKSVSVVTASIFCLAQIIGTIPKCPRSLWVLSLIPIVPYFLSLQAIMSSRQLTRGCFQGRQMHPVDEVIHAAQEHFDSLIQRQSKTYSAAHDEYKRRYGMEPPPGFEAWYEFAKTNQSPIIDDFDIIQKSIAPLLKLSGREVLEVINQVYARSDNEVWLCEYSAQNSETNCNHPHRTFDRHISLLFNRLMSGVPNDIHRVAFLVNHLDEPRVLAATQHSGKSKQIGDRVTQACKFPDSESEILQSTSTDLGLVRNHSLQVDICRHPEYRYMHGLLINPKTFRPIEDLAPILSTGSLSIMGDILFPSPAYIEDEFQYDETHDMDWDNKQNNLYWAGSTSGGYAKGHNWRDFHRHRFVNLIQNPTRKQRYWYLKETNGVVERISSSFLNSRLYNVAFTKIVQCERSSCRDQSAYFNIKPWAHKHKALGSRLTFDLDGNGISGRFYKFLASKSVPLKQTIIQEWHDQRLIPWYHYIPVSQDMTELPELITYLTSTRSGQVQAREIAEQGRGWFSKAFREVDMTIYIYRLLLEMARLQDPTREAS